MAMIGARDGACRAGVTVRVASSSKHCCAESSSDPSSTVATPRSRQKNALPLPHGPGPSSAPPPAVAPRLPERAQPAPMPTADDMHCHKKVSLISLVCSLLSHQHRADHARCRREVPAGRVYGRLARQRLQVTQQLHAHACLALSRTTAACLHPSRILPSHRC